MSCLASAIGHVGPLLGARRSTVMSMPSSSSSIRDVVHPGVVVDLGALQHAEDGAHGVGVEHHGAGQAGALGDHLHVGRGRLGRPDHELDHARPGPAGRG